VCSTKLHETLSKQIGGVLRRASRGQVAAGGAKVHSTKCTVHRVVREHYDVMGCESWRSSSVVRVLVYRLRCALDTCSVSDIRHRILPSNNMLKDRQDVLDPSVDLLQNRYPDWLNSDVKRCRLGSYMLYLKVEHVLHKVEHVDAQSAPRDVTQPIRAPRGKQWTAISALTLAPHHDVIMFMRISVSSTFCRVTLCGINITD
jgi:hypothetical protein